MSVIPPFTPVEVPAPGDDYAQYIAQRMGPSMHALALVAVPAYLAAVLTSAMAAPSAIPLWLRLAPTPLLLVVVLLAIRYGRRPLGLILLTQAGVLLLEVGINLNGIGRPLGPAWVIPGCLLIPVAASMVCIQRWHFVMVMLLCALGPLPFLLGGSVSGPQIFQYAVYMAIAVAVSAVVHTFAARSLLDQFRLERQLRTKASLDDLTGAMHRNHFLELAERALLAMAQAQQPGCLLYLDVDRFKQINDGYGHAAGDAALAAIATVLREHLREGDLLGRLGGEEFAILLPGLPLAQASAAAERLRLAAHSVQRPDGSLTVSIGLTGCRHGEAVGKLLGRADAAMREAKRSGRDRAIAA